MKKVVMLACAALTVGAMSAYAGNVGVVDMKQIFSTSAQVQKIKETLTTRFSSQKKDLDSLRDTLSSDMQKFQKNKTVMSKKDMDSLQSKISAEGAKYRSEEAKFQQAVFAAQNGALNSFLDKVKAVVKTIAMKKDVDVVVPKNSVLYSNSKLDLTQDVLNALK